MGAFLQVGYAIIIVAIVSALITGKKEPILWGLIFFIAATTIAYAGIFTAKKGTRATLGELKPK